MTSNGTVAELLQWLRARAWPLWLERGIDWPRGGFHEHLALDGSGCTADYRRLRVAARQVFVFAHAHRLGLEGAAQAVELGLGFLRQVARQPDGGYACRFSLDHRVIDARRDLYDHAFVLLALASAHQALPAPQLAEQARALHDYLQQHLRHPAGGYRESLPDALPRRQNPHMHLLEALLAAARAFGDERYLQGAHELVTLLLERLIDRATLTLPEWFDANLTLEREHGRHRLEPGHLCEWIWLLDDYRRLTGATRHADQLDEVRAGFARFVARYGQLPGRSDLVDELWSDGVPSLSGARLWPQAERLKAAWLEQERAVAAPVLGGAEAGARALQHWLRQDGLWHERRGADGGWLAEPAPASSLYHLTCAILCVQPPSRGNHGHR